MLTRVRGRYSCASIKKREFKVTAIIGAIVIGFIVGLFARFLKPGNDSAGFMLTTLFGIAGALIATFAGQGMGFYNQGEIAGFLMSLIGAIFVIAIYQVAVRKKK